MDIRSSMSLRRMSKLDEPAGRVKNRENNIFLFFPLSLTSDLRPSALPVSPPRSFPGRTIPLVFQFPTFYWIRTMTLDYKSEALITQLYRYGTCSEK